MIDKDNEIENIVKNTQWVNWKAKQIVQKEEQDKVN